MLTAVLWLAATAHAQDQAWIDVLQTARLNESAYGNHEDAMKGYTQLVRNLAAEDPMRAEALFRLASVQNSLGRMDEARENLIEANRTGVCAADCQVLLGRIDLELGSIRKTPVAWNFSSTDHGLFHPWKYGDKGGIRVQSSDEAANPALIWRTVVDVNKGDQLVVGFERPSPSPATVRFRIQAEDRDASIRVRVVDDMGRNYGPITGPVRVRAERPTAVELDLRKLAPADPADPPLDSGTLARMYIEDVSAFSGTQPGPHALYIDDFEVE